MTNALINQGKSPDIRAVLSLQAAQEYRRLWTIE